MSPDGESVVTGAGDETLRFWNIFSKSNTQKVWLCCIYFLFWTFQTLEVSKYNCYWELFAKSHIAVFIFVEACAVSSCFYGLTVSTKHVDISVLLATYMF